MGSVWKGKYEGAAFLTEILDPYHARWIFGERDMEEWEVEERLKSLKENLELTAKQKKLTHGFTTRDFYDLDVFSNRRMKPPNLTNGIHPIFRDNLWDLDFDKIPSQTGYFRLEDECPLVGDWSMANPIVRNVMHPVLRLASRMISHLCYLPFFDAILNSERVPIDSSRLPEELKTGEYREYYEAYSVCQILPRKVLGEKQIAENQKKLNEIFKYMIEECDFTLAFYQMGRDFLGGQLEPASRTGAYVTVKEQGGVALCLFASTAMVLPLLRPDLNDSERQRMEFYVAKVMTHEVTIFGGVPSPIDHWDIRWPHAVHLGFWLREPWPTQYDLYLSQWYLTDPKMPDTYRLYPLQVSFYEGLQMEEFWQARLAAFGGRALYLGTIKQGVKCTITDGKADLEKIQRDPSLPHQFLNDIVERLIPNRKDPSTLTPEERDTEQFIRALASQQTTEDEFWKNRELMRQSISTILKKNYSSWKKMERSERAALIAAVDQARQSHQRAVQALLELERSQGSIFPERRINLLEWNMGMHEYMRECRLATFGDYEKFFSDPPRLKGELVIEEILAGLGFCRMLLWSEKLRTSDAVRSLPSSQELQSLDSGLKQFDIEDSTAKYMSHEVLQGIFESERCSWFAEQVALCYIIWFRENTDNLTKLRRIETIEKRMLQIRNGLRSFSINETYSVTFSGEVLECPEDWVPRVENALKRIAKLISFLRKQDPEGEIRTGLDPADIEMDILDTDTDPSIGKSDRGGSDRGDPSDGGSHEYGFDEDNSDQGSDSKEHRDDTESKSGSESGSEDWDSEDDSKPPSST
ncbi:hypothetical protein HYFRA_00000230 [Hymenoscyphus fraxineus]|uniref:Uncharacterized protein n=1 Tax=Hymenoscyphus fraxineus TaxID=746836 RepID=A0A9N9PW37_9HELO|nr:hypothetical protein HYFRA_00000230 [Hymenoscyphus fraxineus]